MRLFSKKKLRALGLALLISTATGCSAFFGDDGYLISSSSISYDQDGNTIVTITFNSEEVSPMTITIPKGDDGVGIKDIIPSVDDTSVTLTIKYTDSSLSDTTFTIPIVKGEDGKGITDIQVDTDENGNTILVFKYTDGTTSIPIEIPKGNDGVGIRSIVPTYNEGNKTTSLLITLTDDSQITFEISDGEDGTSIISVVYDETLSTNDTYVLKVIYSNGFEEYVSLPRPQSTKWYSGTTSPTSDIGQDGDFYLNITNGDVFLNINGKRDFKFSMKSDSATQKDEYSTVIFDSNGGTINGSNANAYASTVKGTPVELSEIPTPVKDGFEFLGWYTTKEFNQNAGKLTDLTPVFEKQLFVYAWRE